MEDESEGNWKAEQIRQIFNYWMSGRNSTTSEKQNTTQGGDAEKRFKGKHNAFLKEVQQAYENEWQEVSFTMACDLIGDLNHYLQEKIK